MNDQPSPELNDLVAAAVEGPLNDSTARRLNAVLRSDEAARKFYLDYLEIHALLHWRHGSVEPLEMPLATSSSKKTGALRTNYRLIAAALTTAVAAALVFVIATGRAPWQQPAPIAPIAIVLDQKDVRWSGDSVVAGNQQLHPGRKRIESGIAYIEFSNGVMLAAAGPVDFEITAVDRVHLHHGKLHIYSPLASRGFTVTTPRGVQIVDLGTRFGVWADDADRVHVHLFQGRLRINGRTELSSGEAVDIDRRGKLMETDVDDTLFPSLHRQ